MFTVSILAGCGQNVKTSDNKTVFRYNEASGISSLDPAFARGQADIWACNQLYNGLVQLDDKLNVNPCISKKWSISDDGMLYTFELRNDVHFHHDPLFGSSSTRMVQAEDFVYSFNRILDPKVSSPGSWVFNMVEFDTILGKYAFEAQNDSILTIRLKQAFPPFLGLLTSQYCSVVPHEVVDHFGKDFRKHPVGTGPFQFVQWVERSSLVYHKNPDYFETDNGHKLPYFDAVQIFFISDRQSAFLEFVKGKLDFLSGLDASYKDELLSRQGELKSKYTDKLNMLTGPYLNTEYLGFLVGGPDDDDPVKDIRIRQAINYGFDRVKMIDYLRNGMGTPGEYGMLPPGLPAFNENKKWYVYNPEKSRELLAEAGYPNGKGLPEIVLSTTKEYQDLCEFLQGQLAILGIKIKLEVNPGATQREMVAKQKLNFFRASWIADYPDAENYLSLFYSKNKAPAGPNYTHFENREFDDLYDKASNEVNDSSRTVLYAQMDSIISSQAPMVVLYYDEVIRLFQKDIEGLEINPMNLLNIKKFRKINLSSQQ